MVLTKHLVCLTFTRGSHEVLGDQTPIGPIEEKEDRTKKALSKL